MLPTKVLVPGPLINYYNQEPCITLIKLHRMPTPVLVSMKPITETSTLIGGLREVSPVSVLGLSVRRQIDFGIWLERSPPSSIPTSALLTALAPKPLLPPFPARLNQRFRTIRRSRRIKLARRRLFLSNSQPFNLGQYI